MPANGKSSPQPHDKPNGINDGKQSHHINEKPLEMLHLNPSPLKEDIPKEKPKDAAVAHPDMKPKVKGLLASLDQFMLRLNK